MRTLSILIRAVAIAVVACMLVLPDAPASACEDFPATGVVHVQYASGAPAAGLRVTLTAADGSLYHGQTDPNGIAVIPYRQNSCAPQPVVSVATTQVVQTSFRSIFGQRPIATSYSPALATDVSAAGGPLP